MTAVNPPDEHAAEPPEPAAEPAAGAAEPPDEHAAEAAELAAEPVESSAAPAVEAAQPAAEPTAGAEPAAGPAVEAEEAAPDLDAALAVPLDGSARFAGGRSTPPRAAPDDARTHGAEPPERLLLVPLLSSAPAAAGESRAAEGERCLLVRLAGAERASLLAMDGPGVGETLAEAVASVLHARLGLRALTEPRVAAGRVPARLPQPRRGASGPGWLRAVVVRVEGEPAPGPLLDEVLALPFDEAARALPTDAERRVLGLARE